MKKYLSRKRARQSIQALVFVCIVLLIALPLRSVPLLLICLGLSFACAALMSRANRCPYCGAEFRGCYWSKPDAGYCRKCGKLMEYDDCKHENDSV